MMKLLRGSSSIGTKKTQLEISYLKITIMNLPCKEISIVMNNYIYRKEFTSQYAQ